VTRAAVALLALAALAAPARAADDALREAKKQWRKLAREGRVTTLRELRAHQSAALLRQCERWLGEDDPVVQAEVFRLVAGHAAASEHRDAVAKILAAHIKLHMDERARREDREFKEACRKHGRRIPPGDQMAAGRHWKDPYDESRRELPPEIRAERALVVAMIEAIETTELKALNASLMRIFVEHHDPDVLVRVVQAFGKLKEWRTLPAMADLARIQACGRMMGGADVIGKESYETARLKWDVHKDRLWWSRPEYVPRVSRPILKAAGAITGEYFENIAALDAWLLENEPKLRAFGVEVTPQFRKRAQESQR
jgi:hypothetical protein